MLDGNKLRNLGTLLFNEASNSYRVNIHFKNNKTFAATL